MSGPLKTYLRLLWPQELQNHQALRLPSSDALQSRAGGASLLCLKHSRLAATDCRNTDSLTKT